MSISFRRLRREEIPLIHRWLLTPHVARWWYEDVGTFEEVEATFSACVEGREPVEPYLILHGDSPIGYIQTYRVADDEEYEKHIGIEGASGVDLFIGEKDFLYKGLGAEIIIRFLEHVVFADESVEACIIDPEPTNETAIRAYEKVGFEYVKTIRVPTEPAEGYIMKLPRKKFENRGSGSAPPRGASGVGSRESGVGNAPDPRPMDEHPHGPKKESGGEGSDTSASRTPSPHPRGAR